MLPLLRRNCLVIAGLICGIFYVIHEFNVLDTVRRRRPNFSQPKIQNEIQWANITESYPATSYLPLPSGLPNPIPLIQCSPSTEDRPSRILRLERRAAIKESFEHAWAGYKNHAWLKDEVSPITGGHVNSFGGRAATLVDSLDTLWMMGLYDEFAFAVRALEEIDFSTTELETLNLFETTIRYLGGLLAAYDISGQRHIGLVEKAVVLGDFLYKAFDTPNRMPHTRWEWKQ
jgi:mannosyl-oligosaccharide alpha-1,2-mannosidase